MMGIVRIGGMADCRKEDKDIRNNRLENLKGDLEWKWILGCGEQMVVGSGFGWGWDWK